MIKATACRSTVNGIETVHHLIKIKVLTAPKITSVRSYRNVGYSISAEVTGDIYSLGGTFDTTKRLPTFWDNYKMITIIPSTNFNSFNTNFNSFNSSDVIRFYNSYNITVFRLNVNSLLLTGERWVSLGSGSKTLFEVYEKC